MYKKFGYVRVGCLVPNLKVADTIHNTEELIKKIKEMSKQEINIILTPELSLTGYTCGDLFQQRTLIEECEENLKKLLEETKELDTISVIGMPIKYRNKLYNTAVVISKGQILGIVPKSHIPNYEEYSEKRWFESGINIMNTKLTICNQEVPFGTNLLFKDKENDEICFGIEIGEDLWNITPPSTKHSLNGATIILNPSANNEIIGRYEERKNLVKLQSLRCNTAYCYTSSGINESSTDLVFSGHSMIAENGKLLEENERFNFESNYIYTDIDTQNIVNARNKNNFQEIYDDYNYIDIDIVDGIKELKRTYPKYPFIPSEKDIKDKRCKEIFDLLSSALAKRLQHTGITKTVIGMSGGSDSTLAYLVILEAYKKLSILPQNIIGITMPGFGTTGRTYQNACNLVKNTNATLKEISIKEACLQHFKDIDISPNEQGITYENSQARERTQILMDVANKEGALVVGTGDLSELALGWCTYNGDHMSMYSVNSNIPKTLVKTLLEWQRDNGDKEIKDILADILDTPISPELLPPDEQDNIKQVTENNVGPYILHDFFLYHFIRCKETPEKIYLLAKNTFKDEYSDEEIKKWLYEFFRRFFSQQFKRNCVPDGPKVGRVGLSPRGDFKMSSDVSSQVWLARIKKL